MFILGKCPECGKEDQIVCDIITSPAARCGACGANWESYWRDLLEPARGAGKAFIPSLVSGARNTVWISRPRRPEISQAAFINQALMTAVSLRYQLVCAPAAGIRGYRLTGEWAGCRVEFCEPLDNEIGLHDLRPSLASQMIFGWYIEILRYLCEREVEVNGVKYGRGPILKIAFDDPNGESKARILLHVALVQAGESPRFVRKVFERMDADRLADACSQQRVRAVR